jgi:SAM-dependent methyltransferase
MRPNEARKIGALLNALAESEISPCLNLGSSTGEFRTVIQPHIDEHLFAPLRERRIRVVHSDIKQEDGVDLPGDIYDPATLAAIHDLTPAMVLCCNMFEHVTDRDALARRISEMLRPGGLLIVTVPRSYPIHYDPIDTYFRPTPEEIHQLFPQFELIEGGTVSDMTYLQDLHWQLGLIGTLRHFAKSVVKTVMFWKGRRHLVGHFHSYLWLFRRYVQSYALMRKK